MSKCKYCTQRAKFRKNGFFADWENEITVSEGAYTLVTIGVDKNNRIRIRGLGDDEANYYPKYCPECGRRLEDTHNDQS